MQREILRAIELHGGITPIMASEHGWLNCHGLPHKEFTQLIHEYRIVAPRVLTSQPLRLVWQLRQNATHKETLTKIEREASRLKMKEFAPGGFQLTTAAQDRARGFVNPFNNNPRQNRGRGW